MKRTKPDRHLHASAFRFWSRHPSNTEFGIARSTNDSCRKVSADTVLVHLRPSSNMVFEWLTRLRQPARRSIDEGSSQAGCLLEPITQLKTSMSRDESLAHRVFIRDPDHSNLILILIILIHAFIGLACPPFGYTICRLFIHVLKQRT